MNKVARKCKNDKYSFATVIPTKISQSFKLKPGIESWGVITEFYLESVKVNCYRPGEPTTTAIIKVSDENTGQVVCVTKGKNVGLLFGITPDEWIEVESLCQHGQQLFYRDFKEGISKNFRLEQKLFFNFCKINQTQDVLVAKFKKGVNNRNKDKDDVLLIISELKKCNNYLMDLYIHYLRMNP